MIELLAEKPMYAAHKPTIKLFVEHAVSRGLYQSETVRQLLLAGDIRSMVYLPGIAWVATFYIAYPDWVAWTTKSYVDPFFHGRDIDGRMARVFHR